ncbi:MAG: extracellular solute-binding protein [Treponema sp.]|jgi:ABC-type glycerol-3-phosphate transport system substrate-binding protein|nr:extracellular solute-binding protein [Treponema sp.]
MKEKRKTSILLALMGVLLILLFGCSKKSGTSAAADDGNPFKERVTITSLNYVSSPEPDGRRTDPVSKMLEEKFNINLELSGTTEQDYVAQFSAMMAAGDLPDIVYLPADYIRILAALLASNSLLELDPYVNEKYMPNMMKDPGAAVMFEAYRGSAFSPDGKLRLWGMARGAYDDGSLPSISNFLLWNAYAKAGHPKLETYDEDLLDVMEKMVAAEPRSTSGQKTWGLGGWFGNGGAWGEWVIKFGLSWGEGNEYMEALGHILSIDTDTLEPIDCNQLTDYANPLNNYWRQMRFYNRANQRGLLDPDSFTQTNDMYQEKLKDGRYMFDEPGWMAGFANAEFLRQGVDKLYISIPTLNHKSEYRFANMYRGERINAINAKTKNPERCIALLDYISSKEFSFINVNGPEGINWNYVDGKPVPTEAYLNADTADNAFMLKTGAGVYNLWTGYGKGTFWDDIGMPLDLFQFSPQALERKTNNTARDFMNFYGQKSIVDVYRAETPVTTGVIGMYNFNIPDDLNNDLNGLNAYIVKNYAKVLMAKSDAEFNRLRDEFIAGMKPYNPDRLYDYFYQEALKEKPTVAKLKALMK